MSGLLALIYLTVLIGVPVIAVRWAWLRWTKNFQRGIAVFGGLFGMLGMLWLALGDQWAVDKQVRELCAKDGGVKVYETVKLPTDKFDKWGMVSFYKPTQGENTLGPEYLFKQEMTYYRLGNPDLFRMHTQIIRRSDGKLLGESVFYKRGGGDMPGPWQGSSFLCPELSVANDVLRQVFIME